MRPRRLLAMTTVALLTVPLAGCTGLNQDNDAPPSPVTVIVPGTGYTDYRLDRAGKDSVPAAYFSPEGTRLALAFRSGEVQLWSDTGELLAFIKVVLPPPTCAGNLSFDQFVDEGTFVGRVGECLVLATTGGLVVEWAGPPVQPRYGHLSYSADGRTVAHETSGGAVAVSETFGNRSVVVAPGAHRLALSPDGKFVVVTGDRTEFYGVDVAAQQATLVSTFDSKGRVFFSADSTLAFQVPEPGDPKHVALYAVDGDTVVGAGRSCVAYWDYGPRDECPTAYDRAVSGSPDGRTAAWADELTARRTVDREGQPVHVRDTAAIVRILDLENVSDMRGFQAGPTGEEHPTAGSPGTPNVVAIRLFADGSAAAVTVFTQVQPYGVFLTKAERGCTLPTVEGA